MDPIISTYQRQTFQRSCPICSQNKPLLGEKPHSTSINYDLLQSLKDNVDTLDAQEQTDCTCMYNFQTFWNSQHNKRLCYETNRMPRSAPHITFMEV